MEHAIRACCLGIPRIYQISRIGHLGMTSRFHINPPNPRFRNTQTNNAQKPIHFPKIDAYGVMAESSSEFRLTNAAAIVKLCHRFRYWQVCHHPEKTQQKQQLPYVLKT